MQDLEPSNRPGGCGGPRHLMSRPQRLGVLPTLWFWRDVRTEHPVIGMLIGGAVGVFAVVVGKLLLVAGLNLPLVFVMALFLPLFGLGTVERGLRHLIVRRRRMLTRGEAGIERTSTAESRDSAEQ